MAVGLRPPQPSGESPRPRQRRVLWRMQGPARVVAAAVYDHPSGGELRVYFEPEEQGEILQTELAKHDFTALEGAADTLRELLRRQGWSPLPVTPAP